jgi:flavin-dependent dehydrogenase
LSEHWRSYQLRRSEFDKVLLDNIRRLGAEVIEGASVTEVDLNCSREAVVTATGNNRTTTWSARVVVDASGRAGSG